MKKFFAKHLLVVSFLLVLPIGYTFAQSSDPDVNIEITAKKFEFEPGTIRVKEGDVVEVRLTSADVVHGFGIRALKVNQRVKKGEEKVFRFTASKTGTFPIICTVFCGDGHKNMQGKLIVE